MSARSEDLTKSLKKRSMEDKVAFISHTLELAPESLWQVFGFYQGGINALMNAEREKAGAANAYINALDYALGTRDQSPGIERLGAIHRILYAHDEEMNPGKLRTKYHKLSNKSTTYEYFYNNKQIRKYWFESINHYVRGRIRLLEFDIQILVIDKESVYTSLFEHFNKEMQGAKTDQAKLGHIVNLVYVLGLLSPFQTRTLNPLSILFIQLILDYKLSLHSLIDCGLYLVERPLNDIKTIIANYEPITSMEESQHWQTELNNNPKGLINWSVTSTSPLHQRFFNAILKLAPEETNTTDKFGNTPLINASFHNNYEAVRRLLEEPTVIPNRKGQDYRTAYFWAKNRKHFDILELLAARTDPAEQSSPTFYTSQGLQFGMRHVSQKQEMCNRILNFFNLRRGPIDAMQAAQIWLAHRRIQPEKVLPDGVISALSNPYDFRNAQPLDAQGLILNYQPATIALCRKLALSFADRPPAIDSIFENYEFFMQTEPKSFCQEFDVSEYSPEQNADYECLLNLLIFKNKIHLLFDSAYIAPEIYNLLYTRLLSSSSKTTHNTFNRFVLGNERHLSAFLHYLEKAPPHLLIRFFNYFANDPFALNGAKRTFNSFVCSNETICKAFLSYLFEKPQLEKKLMNMILWMDLESMTHLVKNACVHLDVNELNTLLDLLLRNRKSNDFDPTYNHLDTLLSTYPEIYNALLHLLNSKPEYLQHLRFNIRKSENLLKLVLHSLAMFPLLNDDKELTPETQERMLTVLSWKDLSSQTFFSEFLECFLNAKDIHPNYKQYLGHLNPEILAQATRLFLLSKKTLAVLNSINTFSFYPLDQIRLFADLVVAMPEKNLIGSLLNFLLIIWEANPWRHQEFVHLYIETRLRLNPEKSDIPSIRADFFEAMVSHSNFKYSSYYPYYTRESILDELLRPILFQQEETVQQQRLTVLIDQFIGNELQEKSQYFNKLINHPIIYDLLLNPFQSKQIPSNVKKLLASGSSEKYLAPFCDYVFLDPGYLAPECKIVVFFELPYSLLKNYFPSLQGLMNANAVFKNQFFNNLFHHMNMFDPLVNGLNDTACSAFFIEYLRWIRVNQPNCFQEQSSWYSTPVFSMDKFPEDKITFLFDAVPREKTGAIIEAIYATDDPEFMDWIENSPALVEYFEYNNPSRSSGMSCS